MIAPAPNFRSKHNHGPSEAGSSRQHTAKRSSDPHNHESEELHESHRTQNRTLMGAVTSGLADQAKTAVANKASSFVKNNLIGLIAPIRMTLGNIELIPGVSGIIKTCETWFANNLQSYMDRTGMKIGMPVDEAIDKLLRGDINEFSDDFANSMYNFAVSAIPEQVTEAFSSGSPMKIASALSSAITENVGGIATQMTNPEIKGNFISRPLRYIANFIPFVNKLPEAVKPFVGGAVGFLGLSFLWRMTKGLFKLALVGAAALVGWKFFMGGRKADCEPALAKAK